MNGALTAKIDLALGALDFNAGDWPAENRERHLLEQIALAKKHLQTDLADDQQARIQELEDAISQTIGWIESTNSLRTEDGGESLRILKNVIENKQDKN